MKMFEIMFKVQHDNNILNLSSEFPSAEILVWSRSEHEIIQITADPNTYTKMKPKFQKIGEIKELSSESDVHVVAKKCKSMTGNPVAKHIDSFGILQFFPILIQNGWAHYRTVVFRHGDWQDFLKQLETEGCVVEVLSKLPLASNIISSFMLKADTLFANMTDKQMDALLTAYKNGYYTLPRKADITAIARKKRIPRTTFQEQVKRAENRLIKSLVPYAQLFRQTSMNEKKPQSSQNDLWKKKLTKTIG